MTLAPDNLHEREARLQEVLLAYEEAAESGSAPDRVAWLAHYPEFADELREFFRGRDRVHQLASPLRFVAQAVAAAEGPGTPQPSPPLPGVTSNEPDPAIQRTKFGHYERLELLGQGGMGMVYRARQPSLNRVVALKMIRAGLFATAAEVQRFRNEAEAAARLDHPRIVPIYEVGEHEGRLYFSMKYLEGGNLATQLARLQTDLRAAAALLAAIAQAVHHAHQRGILHRDLKPANILLDAEGRPFVSDFGLAKRVADDTNLTATGELIGTPGYMAPEQAAGDKAAISTATDVYGLGAVLYALLTGQPPFRGDSILTTLEQVRMREPDAPSGSNRRVDRDLETICLKCLEKEPERRYPSAAVLAEDLDHWLTGEPILARPVGRMARLWRWCRRNPVISALTLLTAALLLITLVGLASGLVVIWQKNQEKDEALIKATESLAVARRAVDKMYTQFAEEWLAREPRLQAKQKEFLEDALQFYRDFAREQGTDPAARYELAMTYARIGRDSRDLGRIVEMEAAYLKAIEILEQLANEYPDVPGYQHDLGHCYKYLGWARDSDRVRCEAAHNRAVAIHRRLAAQFPDTPEYESDLANSLQNLSDAVDPRLQQKAADLNRQAVAMWERLLRDHPPRPDYFRGLCPACTQIAGRLAALGQFEEAARMAEKGAQYMERLKGAGAPCPEYHQEVLPYNWLNLGRAHLMRGAALLRSGQFESARRAFSRSLAIHQRLFVDGRGVLLDVFLSQRGLCEALEALGRPGEADATYRQGLQVFEQLAKDLPAPYHCCALARYLVDSRRPELANPSRAVQLASEALRTVQRNPSAGCPVVECWKALGRAQFRAGAYEAARQCFTNVATIQANTRTSQTAEDHFDLFFLAMACHRLGDRENARLWYERALAAKQDTIGSAEYLLDRLETEAAKVMASAKGKLTIIAESPGSLAGSGRRP
jgi:serine/threonine-protein kinase